MTKETKVLIIAGVIIAIGLLIGVNVLFGDNNVVDVGSLVDVVSKNDNIIANNNLTNTDIIVQDKKVENEKIIIHISGEVVNSGIIELEAGSRIADAIAKAGGLTENADLKRVNLAYELKDAQKIYIPSIEDEEMLSIEQDNGDGIVYDGINGARK